jgi:hypothetical protein
VIFKLADGHRTFRLILCHALTCSGSGLTFGIDERDEQMLGTHILVLELSASF